jgi:hypothetical protein
LHPILPPELINHHSSIKHEEKKIRGIKEQIDVNTNLFSFAAFCSPHFKKKSQV